MRTSDTPQRSTLAKLLNQGMGLVVLPVIPLYMLAYRLMGRRCVYRWPETDVRPTDYTPILLLGRWQESPYFLSKLMVGLFAISLAVAVWLVETLS